MSRYTAALLAICLSTCVPLRAEGTRTWQQSTYEDFVKGTSHGVAISSDNVLELAPSFKLVASTPSSAVWATAIGPHGEIYAATGAPARVYSISPGGQPLAIFEPQELQVQALVVDKNGVLYAATNPDGKVYKIEHTGSAISEPQPPAKTKSASGWNASVYFDPQTKYIWSLALDSSGNLYVGTGDHGQIFRVTPNGQHTVFFRSDEPHIRVVTLDKQGNLIAGSDGSGLIYRISPEGKGFVLYSAPKREITSIAIDAQGNIYAAAAGEKRAGGGSSSVSVVIPGAGEKNSGSENSGGHAPESVTLSSGSSAVPGGSEIFRISASGAPERLWNSRDDLVYALAFDARGHLLAGTGNRGQIYEVHGREDYSELLKAGANQVTAFAKSADGGLYASTSNLGKIFLLSGSSDSDGEYESDVFDAHIFSKWGRAEFRGQGNVDLFARSGNVDNPDRNWSPWEKIDLQRAAQVTAPPARFVQWKAVLHPGSTAPRVENVTLNYLPQNIAPEFDDVIVTPGTRYQSPPRPPNLEPGQRVDAQPIVVHDRQFIGVKWTVRDDNDDQMMYSIYYQGDGQKRWLLLKDNLTEKFYSLDASLLPDGGYTVKVVASDAPSHSSGEALSSEKESDRFEVDTTPPLIQNLKASWQGGSIHVQFRAADSFSPIKHAEYSLDAGDWQFIEPVGQLSDSKLESYDFSLPSGGLDAGQEHVIVVRAYDRYENMNVAKAIVNAK